MGLNLNNILRDIKNKVAFNIGIDFGGTGIGRSPDTEQRLPTDVSIEEIAIYGPGLEAGESLLPVVKEINLYESIFSPVIFANLNVFDASDLYTKYNLANGDWFVEIAFKSPEGTDASRYRLAINNIIGYQQVASNKGATYTMQCVSPELRVSDERYYDDAVEDFPHNAIRQILENEISTSKEIRIHQEADISINEPFARYRPLVAIDNLRKLCVSHRYPSSCFVFYEDRNGYHLNTIENMIESQKPLIESGSSDKVFFFDSLKQQSVSASSYRSVLAFNEVESGDILQDINMGALRNVANAFDPIQGGDYRRVIDSNSETRTNITTDESGQPFYLPTTLERSRSSVARTDLVTVYADKTDLLTAEVLTSRLSFISGIIKNIRRVYVYGDTELKIGDMISIDFIVPADIEGEDNRMVRTSGNYLVTKIRHMILNDDRPKYMMAMELIKSGLESE
jgi:hypothetical protein